MSPGGVTEKKGLIKLETNHMKICRKNKEFGNGKASSFGVREIRTENVNIMIMLRATYFLVCRDWNGNIVMNIALNDGNLPSFCKI